MVDPEDDVDVEDDDFFDDFDFSELVVFGDDLVGFDDDLVPEPDVDDEFELELDVVEDEEDLLDDRERCGGGEVALEVLAILSKKDTREEMELFSFGVCESLRGVDVG